MAYRTMKAKTSPTGYMAVIQYGETRVEFPVARFDDDGHAMIADPDTGILQRAHTVTGFLRVWPMLQAASR